MIAGKGEICLRYQQVRKICSRISAGIASNSDRYCSICAEIADSGLVGNDFG